MAAKLPQSTKVLAIRQSKVESKPLYHDAVVEERHIPPLKAGEVLVRMRAVSFNRKDLWIRMGQYPDISFGSVFGGDGAGTVIASSDPNDLLLQKRVFLTPMRGWKDHPEAPESEFGILGGGKFPPLGTFAQYIIVERDQVLTAPDHLDDVHLSAWPLGGLTAWRAVVVNARVEAGQNVLITGIGGGVALLAMQICIAKGASVYVTSSQANKIAKAVSLGAKGGVNYRDKDWVSQLKALLRPNGAKLDSIIDSGGEDIMGSIGGLLKNGGRVVCYGMTGKPKITFTMREVLRNQQLIGSTMGSYKDLVDATNFMAEHRIIPVVSHVLNGLESAEEGFELLKNGDQFGKIVISFNMSDEPDKAKL